MTIITKVGASYADHMNDDVPEDNSFSRRCYQAVLFVYVIRVQSFMMQDVNAVVHM